MEVRWEGVIVLIGDISHEDKDFSPLSFLQQS